MGCLGLHISVDAKQVAAIKAVADEDRVDFVQEELEGKLWSEDKSRAQETDKAWDAIHRALTDGTLRWNSRGYPLSHVILGGELLYKKTSDYIISLKTPDQVRDITAAIRDVTQPMVRNGYDKINPKMCGYTLDDQDFEYTWSYFTDVARFYERAASHGYAVIFTASQ